MTTGMECMMKNQPTIGEVIAKEKRELEIALINMVKEYEHVCELAGIEPRGSWAYYQAKNILPNAD